MIHGFSRWREGGLLLFIVRSLALSLAVAQFFIFYNSSPFLVHSFIVIGVVSAYTIARLIYPFHWYGRKHSSYLLISSDVIICCTLPFVTGGFNSPFILYPLTAILSASLYFPKRTAYATASIVAASVVSSEILARLVFNSGLLLPVQLYVALMGMYVVVGFLIAWLPYVANINYHATIKRRAILEERRRLSRELHDGPAQRLAALMMKLDLLGDTIKTSDKAGAMSQLTGLKNELKTAHLEVRETIDQLRLQMSESPGMLPVLAQYTREFSRESHIPCHTYLSDGHTELSPLATVEILRVAQEALTNVRKHSGASKVDLKFESGEQLITMIIKDNGRGFAAENVSNRHGIAVMQERVESLGGKFEILSSPGSGTEIRVTVPSGSNSIGAGLG